MARFAVMSHLTHDGKEYAVGAMVDMTDKQAAAIPWAVEAVAAPKAPEAKQEPKSSPSSKSEPSSKSSQ